MLHFLNQYYYPISVIIIIAFCFIMGIYYSRKLSSRELVLIAILSALAAISRIAFYWIPQFKPQAAMVFVCASIFGSVPGMIVGLLSGFLANFVMGQGPWTPFQMLGFGLVGIVGGFTDTDKTYIAAIVGFISTFVLIK